LGVPDKIITLDIKTFEGYETNYAENFEYESTVNIYTDRTETTTQTLTRLHTPEGYITTVSSPQYHYYRRDHLGNNREVWLANTNTTLQRTQYYPSGLPWAESVGASAQNRKYNGKEFVEMHGWDESDLGWRGLHNAKFRFDSFDPDAEIDSDISPYAACHNNPVLKVDPNGRWVETVWDVVSLGMGVSSLVSNIKQGNVGAAIVDGLGVIVDGLATVAPIVPAGAGAAIKAARAGDKIVDVVKTGKTTEKVVEGGRAGKTIAKENGVTVKSYGTNDAHKPAHAHVKGGGKEVRVGPNGKPLKGQPELSDKQKKVIDNNRKEIRKEVNAVGKENKKIEEQNQRR
jgi:RHS repeat-associated protein